MTNKQKVGYVSNEGPHPIISLSKLNGCRPGAGRSMIGHFIPLFGVFIYFHCDHHHGS
jgi:hypothetical protein